MKESVQSLHTFMFPFVFKRFQKNNRWRYKKFKIENQRDYNEYVYFYKHVRDALFNIEDEDKEFISKYYEYEKQNGKFVIDCQKGKYELEIDSISLRVFNTDVAIISFNLKNYRYKDPKDVLAINDFGRRTYPQFLGNEFTKDPKRSFLANKITIELEDETPIEEDFSKFDRLENLDIKNLNLIPKHIDHFLDGCFDEDIQPIIDDRMYVISLYLSSGMSNRLKSTIDGKYFYETDDWWYKYVFIDGDSKTCKSKYMSKEFIRESTYDRWVEDGTLFGISRYSFTAVSSGWFGENILLAHMQTMYFQIFTLLLAYRASIIKFSNDIQDITENKKNIAEETRELYDKYLKFLNKLYFKEVTAQDQGIELYDKALKIMKIEQHLADLDNELNELHSYVEMLEDKEESKSINNLTKLGTIFLPASFIASIFGMNIFPDGSLENIGGWVVSFGLMIGTTWWLGIVHKIKIFEFLGINGQKEKNEQV